MVEHKCLFCKKTIKQHKRKYCDNVCMEINRRWEKIKIYKIKGEGMFLLDGEFVSYKNGKNVFAKKYGITIRNPDKGI